MAGAAVAAVVSSFAAEAASVVVADALAVTLAETAISGAVIVDASFALGSAAALVGGQIVGGAVNSVLKGGGGGAGGNNAVSAARAEGTLLNVSSNVEALPVIYGKRKVGGARPFIELSAIDTNYLNVVITLGEGEISSVDQIYINDIPWNDSRYAGLVTLEIYTGTDSQAASAALIADLGGKWTAAHRGAGVAYLYLRLKFDGSVFTGMPTITADVSGRKVYDPRTGLTVWSENPALCIRDYLTNARYGRGLSASQIDDASFIAAANHCDEVLGSVKVLGITFSTRRYTCNGVVDINRTLFENTRDLLTSCRGSLVYSGGLYKLVIDKLYTGTPQVFNEDNITGNWNIVRSGKRGKFNRVTAAFFNQYANWQPDFGVSDSTAYRTLDNGLTLEGKLDLPFTSDSNHARQLAGLMLKQSRFGTSVRFTAFQEGLRAEVGDVIAITHTTPSWSAKKFRVSQIEIRSAGEVEISAYEYDDTVYNLDALTDITSAPASSLPDPFVKAQLTGLVASSGTGVLTIAQDGSVVSRIQLAWNSATDPFVLSGGSVQIEFQRSGETQWSQVQARGDATSAFLSGVTDAATYSIRARFENSIGVRGDWMTIAHTVIGKTAPPSTPTGLSLTQTEAYWSKVTDLDLEGYQLRMIAGSTANWGQGTPLHDGLITAIPHTFSRRLYGTNTVMLVAQDTTGNISGVASATLDFGQPSADNVGQSLDYAALGFPGTLSGCSVSGGNLVANTDPASDVYALADVYSQDDVYGTYYTAMQWVTPVFSPRYGGGTLTLTSSIAGASVLVEYQIDGSTVNDVYALGDVYAAADLYGASSNWQPWPGALEIGRGQGVIFRVTVAAGATQGVVSAFKANLILQELSQTFSSWAVSAAGTTRVPPASGTPARNWVSVRTVQMTPILDGSGVVLGRSLDFHPQLGPAVQGLDATFTPVTGTFSIDVRGIADV